MQHEVVLVWADSMCGHRRIPETSSHSPLAVNCTTKVGPKQHCFRGNNKDKEQPRCIGKLIKKTHHVHVSKHIAFKQTLKKKREENINIMFLPAQRRKKSPLLSSHPSFQ